MGTDFSEFESPSYSGQSPYSEENYDEGNSPVEMVKANAKYIIAVLAVLVIAYFAFNYFVASVKEIEISITDTEGNPISSNNLLLLDSAGNEVFSGSNQKTYSVPLRTGKYRYKVEAGGFSNELNTFNVTDSGETSLEIVASKDVGVEILDFKDNIPVQWIAGQTKIVEFNVKNTKSSSTSAEIVFERELEEWGTTSKNVSSIPGNGTKLVSVEIKVPKTIDTGRNGKDFTLKARVKYTTNSQTKEVTVFPSPEINLNVRNFTKSVDAGETLTRPEIEVENKSDFPIEDLELSIEITSAIKNRSSVVVNWFKFQEKAEEPEAWKMAIESIDSDSETRKAVRIDVPLTAKKETISGKVVLNASFLSHPIQKTFNLTIENEANFSLELSTRASHNISWFTDAGKYDERTEILEVKNAGDLKLENIEVSVKNFSECNTDWLTLLETRISELESGATQDITLIVSAPISAHNPSNPGNNLCKIKYRFDNPLTGEGEEDFKTGEMANWISIDAER